LIFSFFLDLLQRAVFFHFLKPIFQLGSVKIHIMVIGIDASRAFIKQRTGTENYSYQLIKALTKIDRQNRYFLYTKPDSKVDFPLPPNFQLKSISFPRLWTQLGLASRTFLDPLEVLFIPAHTLPLVRKPGLKTVVTIHGLEYEYLPEYYRFPQRLLLNRSTEYAVRHADRLIAVSQWTKKELVTRLAADPKKITVIYEGVDQDKFQISRPEADRPPDEKIKNIKEKYRIKGDYVLFVGTIQPRKNLERLIEAFSLLAPSYPALDLVLAGKLGWLYDKILKAPQKFKVRKRVQFLGHVSDGDLAVLYQKATVFCLPSLTEGFGLPVLEAMAAGTPVVAAKTGALPEIVGKAGLLIDPLKVREIAGAIGLILENKTLAEGLRGQGFTRVKQFFWGKTGRQTLKIIASWNILL